MHLQESTLFYLGVKVIHNVALYPPHHVKYAPAKFEVAMSSSFGRYAFARNMLFDINLAVKVTKNVAQYPLHNVT